jgi:hypothetical protein
MIVKWTICRSKVTIESTTRGRVIVISQETHHCYNIKNDFSDIVRHGEPKYSTTGEGNYTLPGVRQKCLRLWNHLQGTQSPSQSQDMTSYNIFYPTTIHSTKLPSYLPSNIKGSNYQHIKGTRGQQPQDHIHDHTRSYPWNTLDHILQTPIKHPLNFLDQTSLITSTKHPWSNQTDSRHRISHPETYRWHHKSTKTLT